MATQSTVKELIESFGADVVEAAARNLGATRRVGSRTRRAVATGTLKNSLTYVNKSRYGNPVINFTAKDPAKAYASYVHDGRRPGSTPPPVRAILKWISDRNIRPRRDGKFIPKSKTIDPKYNVSVTTVGQAFAIARGIGKRGIPALPYYAEAIDSVLESRGAELVDALKKEIEIRLVLK